MRKRAQCLEIDFSLDHDPGFDHVKSPERLKGIYKILVVRCWLAVLWNRINRTSLAVMALNHSESLIARVSRLPARFLIPLTLILTPHRILCRRLSCSGCLIKGVIW